jgi:cbb3-type cytochrome oxidase subunit 3
MKGAKLYIVIGLIVAAVAVGYYWYQNGAKTLGQPASNTPFDLDDAAAYNQMRALMQKDFAGDLAWFDDAVREIYDRGPNVKVIAGQAKSKAGAFLEAWEAAVPNTKGRYAEASNTPLPADSNPKNSDGTNVTRWLWPESLHQQLWSIWSTLKTKYGGL